MEAEMAVKQTHLGYGPDGKLYEMGIARRMQLEALNARFNNAGGIGGSGSRLLTDSPADTNLVGNPHLGGRIAQPYELQKMIR